MNAIFIIFIVIFIFAGLFFSLYVLFKSVFLSIHENIYGNFGDIILSSPPGLGVDSSSVFLSAIFAAVISVLIIVLGAIIVIKKGSLVRVVKK